MGYLAADLYGQFLIDHRAVGVLRRDDQHVLEELLFQKLRGSLAMDLGSQPPFLGQDFQIIPLADSGGKSVFKPHILLIM